MPDPLDPSIDRASYVSLVRDALVPESVQHLVAALVNHADRQWLDAAIGDEAYSALIDTVLETPDTDPAALTAHLMGQRAWQPVALALTALRCLEADCRSGDYTRTLPSASRDVLIAALRWQVDLASDG